MTRTGMDPQVRSTHTNRAMRIHRRGRNYKYHRAHDLPVGGGVMCLGARCSRRNEWAGYAGDIAQSSVPERCGRGRVWGAGANLRSQSVSLVGPRSLKIAEVKYSTAIAEHVVCHFCVMWRQTASFCKFSFFIYLGVVRSEAQHECMLFAMWELDVIVRCSNAPRMLELKLELYTQLK